jgi:polyisoprenoid-binding protein YceI
MTATQTATPSKTTTWPFDPAHNHVEFAGETFDDGDCAWSFGDVTGTLIVAGDLRATAHTVSTWCSTSPVRRGRT